MDWGDVIALVALVLAVFAYQQQRRNDKAIIDIEKWRNDRDAEDTEARQRAALGALEANLTVTYDPADLRIVVHNHGPATARAVEIDAWTEADRGREELLTTDALPFSWDELSLDGRST